MKRKVKELKRIARHNLTGNYSILIKASILISGLMMLIEWPFSMLQTKELVSTQNIIYYIALVLISIVSIVLICGQYRMHLSLARTGQMNLNDLFSLLKNQPDKYILVNLLLFGLAILSMFPAFIGGAMIYFSQSTSLYPIATILFILSILLALLIAINFNLVFFVLLDNPDLSTMEAFKATLSLMKGHKARYLYLQLSFLGMLFLAVCSLGIAMLWVEPYMTQTITLFYLDAKGVLDEVQEERRKSEPTPEPTTFNQYV